MNTAQKDTFTGFSNEDEDDDPHEFDETSHVNHHEEEDHEEEQRNIGSDCSSSRLTFAERIFECHNMITFKSAFFGDNKRICKGINRSDNSRGSIMVQLDLLVRRMNLIILLINPFFDKEEYFNALEQQLVRNFNICTTEYFNSWAFSIVSNGRIVTPVNHASRRKNDDTRGYFCYREFRNIRNAMFFEWQKLFWFPCHVKTCKALANVNLWLNRCVILFLIWYIVF